MTSAPSDKCGTRSRVRVGGCSFTERRRLPYKTAKTVQCTVNPLYNGIRHNSIIRYNVNSVDTKISGSCIFSVQVPCYSLGKRTFWIFVRIASERRGDSNKYIKCMIIKNCLKVFGYSWSRRVRIKYFL